MWHDLSPELSQRLLDVCSAVAAGHDSLFIQAEAIHLLAAIDSEMNVGVYSTEFTEDESGADYYDEY